MGSNVKKKKKKKRKKIYIDIYVPKRRSRSMFFFPGKDPNLDFSVHFYQVNLV